MTGRTAVPQLCPRSQVDQQQLKKRSPDVRRWIQAQGTVVTLDQLAGALGTTKPPVQLVVLNACDSLAGAEVLLESVPVVIATTRSISDLAATVFASRFYAAVASGRSVRHAIDQAKYAIDVLAGGEGDVIESLTREGVDLDELVLVKPPATDLPRAV